EFVLNFVAESAVDDADAIHVEATGLNEISPCPVGSLESPAGKVVRLRIRDDESLRFRRVLQFDGEAVEPRQHIRISDRAERVNQPRFSSRGLRLRNRIREGCGDDGKQDEKSSHNRDAVYVSSAVSDSGTLRICCQPDSSARIRADSSSLKFPRRSLRVCG